MLHNTFEKRVFVILSIASTTHQHPAGKRKLVKQTVDRKKIRHNGIETKSAKKVTYLKSLFVHVSSADKGNWESQNVVLLANVLPYMSACRNFLALFLFFVIDF